MKADVGENISSVVEDCQSQAVFDCLERNARLSVHDEKLIASPGHLDVGAVCRRAGVANLNLSLGTRAIQRKTAQRVAAAGEECFAQRHPAARVRLGQTDANAVRPNNVVKRRPIVGQLGGEFCKIDARTELGVIKVELNALQCSLLRVERIIAGIVGEVGRDGGEAYVPVLRKDEIGDQDARQVGLTEAVAQEESVVLFLVD